MTRVVTQSWSNRHTDWHSPLRHQVSNHWLHEHRLTWIFGLGKSQNEWIDHANVPRNVNITISKHKQKKTWLYKLIWGDSVCSARVRKQEGNVRECWKTVLDVRNIDRVICKIPHLHCPCMTHDDVIKWKHFPRYYLCGEFTGPRWIPHTKASDAELWCFLWSAFE